MKKIISILAVLVFSLQLYSQQETMKLLRMEIGPGFHFNNLNEDSYFRFMNRNYIVQNVTMPGFNMKFVAEYKDGLDITFGALAGKGWIEVVTGYNPGSTNSDDYVLNGGAVYFGLNPHTRGKHFGLDADIAGGIFAFKEYRMIFNNVEEPMVSILDKKSSILGGLATVGFYMRGNLIGISPEAQLIMAGGSNGSFLFWGFHVPVTINL